MVEYNRNDLKFVEVGDFCCNEFSGYDFVLLQEDGMCVSAIDANRTYPYYDGEVPRNRTGLSASNYEQLRNSSMIP